MTNATVCATLRLSGDTIQGSCDRVRSLVELLAAGRDVPRADIDGARSIRFRGRANAARMNPAGS
jgi:hypothetical protein